MRELVYIDRHTKIVGKDIEFVLGNSPQGDRRIRRMNSCIRLWAQTYQKAPLVKYVTISAPSLIKRTTNLWSLDFDAYGSVTMNQARFDLAFDFGNRYLATAKKILHQRDENLPLKFLTGVSKLLNRQSIPQPLSAPGWSY